MKARLQISSLMILALLLSISCARPSFSLMGIHTSVSSIHHYDGEGNLTSAYESLGVFIESEEDASLQMEVTSPDGLDTWLFPAVKQTVDKQLYYGKSGLSLGTRVPLPRGEWSLRILRSDGRTITEHFTLEKGFEVTPFEHHFDAEKGVLFLDEQVREYALQLLDEKKRILFATTTTEQSLDLKSFYPKWDTVRFLALSWYDEAAKQSLVAWYDL